MPLRVLEVGVSMLRHILLCPFKVMARIAATEETDDIRDEEDDSSAEEQAAPSHEGDTHIQDPSHSTQDNQMEEDLSP